MFEHQALKLAVKLHTAPLVVDRKESDRRSERRFEVVGQLWGYFSVSDSVEVQNISDGGALTVVEAPVREGAVHRVHVDSPGQPGDLRMRVKHVRLEAAGNRHVVGLECVDENRKFWDQIVDALTGRKGDSGGSGGA